jgi:hypothetical protein
MRGFWVGIVSLGVVGGLQGGEVDWARLALKLSAPVTPEAQAWESQITSQVLEALKGLYFDSELTVEEFLVQNPILARRLEGIELFPRPAETRYLSDGSREVSYEVSLTGPILDLFTPTTGGGVPVTPMCCPLCKRPWPEDLPVPPGITLVPQEEEHPIPYTGILVDARGLDLDPALFPKILNEDGQEVYGLGFVLRPYAVERGLISYVTSPQEAYQLDRIGMNPLRVSALRVTGRNRSDLVIPNPEAQRVHSQRNLKLLERCQVVVVVDRL